MMNKTVKIPVISLLLLLLQCKYYDFTVDNSSLFYKFDSTLVCIYKHDVNYMITYANMVEKPQPEFSRIHLKRVMDTLNLFLKKGRSNFNAKLHESGSYELKFTGKMDSLYFVSFREAVILEKPHRLHGIADAPVIVIMNKSTILDSIVAVEIIKQYRNLENYISSKVWGFGIGLLQYRSLSMNKDRRQILTLDRIISDKRRIKLPDIEDELARVFPLEKSRALVANSRNKNPSP
ncbi:hypothetical protein QA601_18800 [Chitinispirillales bacterium ANBcel5]|uniref:hypothetical protein n=1 Tax=Cellulosispirillum alkaliphilum TaxID=3039283 RepID=UPI002A50C975|nr:hypothetical protein [Chitinispirillales bacterium ANBcel5]